MIKASFIFVYTILAVVGAGGVFMLGVIFSDNFIAKKQVVHVKTELCEAKTFDVCAKRAVVALGAPPTSSISCAVVPFFKSDEVYYCDLRLSPAFGGACYDVLLTRQPEGFPTIRANSERTPC